MERPKRIREEKGIPSMTSLKREEKPEHCDFCGYGTKELTWYSRGYGGWLCSICASTAAGNVGLYPTSHQLADVDVLKTVVGTTHMILDALAKEAEEAKWTLLATHHRGEGACPDPADACWGCSLRKAEEKLGAAERWALEQLNDTGHHERYLAAVRGVLRILQEKT